MPLGTDLSRLLTKEEPATPQEAETIRMELNRLQSQVSQLSGLVDARGNLDANIFSHKSGQFSVLPHQAASMIRVTDQSIPYNTLTAVTFTADAGLTAAEKRMSYAHGIRRDQSTGDFFLEGIPESTLWQFTAIVYWKAGSIPDNWYATVYEKDTTTGAMIIFSDNEFFEMGTITLRARIAAASWQLNLLNVDSGEGAKTITEAVFQVARIR